MKNKFWEEMAKPFVVLVVICLASAGLLGFLNSKTAPVIEENKRIEAENTRKAVLPAADGFEEVAVSDAGTVTSVFKATNGAGYVVTASAYGYHGNVTVTIGFDADGKILDLKADVSTETSGVGSKAGKPEYLAKYIGLSDGIDKVDTISGATYSSSAVKTAVTDAVAALAKVR